MSFWRKKKCCCGDCFYQAQPCPGEENPPEPYPCLRCEEVTDTVVFRWSGVCWIVDPINPLTECPGTVVSLSEVTVFPNCAECLFEPPPPCFVQTVPCNCPEPPPGPAPWVSCTDAIAHAGDVVFFNGYCWVIVTSPQFEELPPGAVLIDPDDEVIHTSCATCCPPPTINACTGCEVCPETVMATVSGLQSMIPECADGGCCVPDCDTINIPLTRIGNSCSYTSPGLLIPGCGEGGCDLQVSQVILQCFENEPPNCNTGQGGWYFLMTFDTASSCYDCEFACPTSPQIFSFKANPNACPQGDYQCCPPAAGCGDCHTSIQVSIS